MKNVLFRIKNWFIRHKPSKRRIIQLYTALLYNANLKGFIKGEIFTGSSKVACVPGLNCYSCPGAIGSCPLGALQGAISKSNKSFPYYVIGILLLYGLIFGRTICGWLCPVGLCQELVYKIKSPKLGKSKYTRLLSYLKYVILVIFVFLIPLAYSKSNLPIPGFCKYICPAGMFEGAFFLLGNPNNEGFFSMLGSIFTWKLLVFIIIFVACIFIYRCFCRFICPLGAIYGLFNKFSILGVKVNNDTCTNCGLCVKKCKMDIRKVGDHECINCGDCISVCPTNAIQWKGKKFELPPNQINVPLVQDEVKLDIGKTDEVIEKPQKNKKKTFKIITQVGAVILLLGTLVYAYFGDKKEEVPNNDIAKEGQTCKNFEIKSSNGKETFSIDGSKGKITIINFWYINCPGCIAELPDFEEFYQEYKDSVEVIAINPIDTTEEIEGFLIDIGWENYGINFGVDDKEDNLTSYFPINEAYPFTAILDSENTIKKLHSGSMNKTQLVEYYNQFK